MLKNRYSRRTVTQLGAIAGSSLLMSGTSVRAQTPPAMPLRVAVPDSPLLVETLRAITNQFAGQRPDIPVSIESVQEDYVGQISAANQAGSGYDLIVLSDDQFPAAVAGSILQPLDQAVLDLNGQPSSVVNAVTQNNALLALPWSWSPVAVLYDEVVLEAVGVQPFDPPWNWNGLRGLLIALKDSIGQPSMSMDATFEHFYLFWTQSSDVPEGSGDLVKDMESEATNRALGYINGLFRNWLAMTSDRFLAASADDAFVQGMTSVAYTRPTLVQRVLRETPERIMVTGIVPEGKANRMTTAHWTAVGLGQGTAKPDGAMALAAFLTGTEAGRMMWDGTGELPTSRASMDALTLENPVLAGFAASTDYTFVGARWSDKPNFVGEADAVIQEVVAGQIDVDEAQARMVEAAIGQDSVN